MSATKIKKRYYLFMDELGEYFIVMHENKTHATETAKDWFAEKISFQMEIGEIYAEQSGLDIY